MAGGFRSGWQDRIMKRFPEHTYLDPRSHGLKEEKDYTEWDLNAIRKSDLIIAYLEDTNPAGHNMMFELGYALALSIPFILISDNEQFDRYIGMPRVSSNTYYTNFEKAIENLHKILGEMNWSSQKR